MMTDQTMAGRRLFDCGMCDFNAGRYFEAHDHWEDLWHRLRGPDRRFVQALIHITVGAYHYGNSNSRGASSQWRKACEKLARYPDGHWGIDTSGWREWIARYLAEPSLPSHPRDLPFDTKRFPDQLLLAPE